MAIVKLKDAGVIRVAEGEPLYADASLIPTSLDRPAMLVYAGAFESMNGPVEVTADDVERLVANHNSLLTRVLAAVATGGVPLKGCPPIQLDHSTSARDTVGRLVGPLSVGAHTPEGATATVPCVLGTLRVLGRENVERVLDGRWIHLSLGADFGKGKVAELTITPFPAAAEASLLTADGKVKSDTKPAEEAPEMKNRGKLKKFLMGPKKLSEADAEKELSRLAADDCKEELSRLEAEDDENDKKLAAEDADKKDKDEKDRQEKLSAARGKITQLSSGFRGVVDGARLAAKQGRILTRLSKLRAEAKITPAEVKKLDIAKLAGESDAAVELVMKTYADREPVIMVGQLGSSRAVNLGTEGKAAKMSQMEADSRARMSLLSKTAPTTTAGATGAAAAAAPEKTTDENAAYVEKEYGELCQLMAAGKGTEAKDRLKAFMLKCSTAELSSGDFVEANAAETEKHLSALAENMTAMQAQFNELQQLAMSLVG